MQWMLLAVTMVAVQCLSQNKDAIISCNSWALQKPKWEVGASVILMIESERNAVEGIWRRHSCSVLPTAEYRQ